MTEETTGAADSPDADCSAAETLHRAKAEFEKARAYYQQVRQQATERLEAVRRTTVGEMIDCSLRTVKRHPVAGLTIAAILGYYLGRLFRR